ncbi:MAG: nodulation protein NfeD [Thermoanaerobacterales bacterium]|nr:nodulation protein NfeD [Thermoanaerobacterales bacterium]
MSNKLITAVIIMVLIFASTSFVNAGADDSAVYVIPIKGVINKGLASFVERGISEAEKNGAKAIVFVIDTPGGEIGPAVQISDAIMSTQVKTIAHIDGEATSAGVILAVSCDIMAVSRGATIGAAEPRPNEEKYVSYWSSKLRNAAQIKGRNPQIVAAMADADVVIEGLKEKGKILSLTSQQAIELDFADMLAENVAEILQFKGIGYNRIVKVEPSTAEKIANFITNPYVMPILLTLGIIGITTELLTPGFGVPGFIAFIAFALFFGGNLLIGSIQYWVLWLFLFGIIMVMVEIFIPGFGVFGIMGIIGVITSMFMVFPSIEQAIISLLISLVASCIVIYLLIKYFKKKLVLYNFILKTRQEKSDGYIASIEKKEMYLNKKGKAITPLRPAGVGVFDGNRLDVVTEGEFVPANSDIEIIRVEGGRIIVRKMKGE